jgi:lipoyl(octanoyl) transferase
LFFCFLAAMGRVSVSAFVVGSSSSSGTISMYALAPQQLGSFEQLDYLEEKGERKVALQNLISPDPSERDLIPFETAWNWQKQQWDGHAQRLTDGDAALSSFQTDKRPNQSGVDTVFILEHAPVYTLGTGSDEKYILSDSTIPTVRMDRGGEVTYHGNGQITVYPVLDLRNYRQDIHWYMRALEEVVLTALREVGIDAERQDDTTGVWYQNHKLAAIGIKCRKWVTQHGFAVNVLEESLENFDGIVPCGLVGRKVGCINQFLEKPITMGEFSLELEKAMEKVFQITLVKGSM